MVGGQADVKLVSNAMANATRRKIMAMLVEKERTRVEFEQVQDAPCWTIICKCCSRQA